MSVYLFSALFYLLLFLLMCGTLCTQMCATADSNRQTSTAKNSVEVFQTGQAIGKVFKTDGNNEEPTAKDVKVEVCYSPALVSSGDVIVVLAAIKGNTVVDNKITVLTKYTDTKSHAGWAENVFKTSGGGGWKAQFAVYGDSTSDPDTSVVVRGLVAAVAKNKNIYLFSVNASLNLASNGSGDVSALEFRLVEGTVDSTSADKKITWAEKTKLTSSKTEEFKKKFEGQKLSKGVFSGSAIVTNEGKVIFLLKTQTKDKKSVFGFYFSDGVEKAEKLEFLPLDGIVQGCYPQFFLWKESVMMVPTECTENVGEKKVNETTDVTKTQSWKDNTGPFSHFVGFFNDKSDFTTANIQKNTNNNDVLLFTQKKKPKQQSTDKDNCDVFLWVTDSKRFYNAGAFLPNVNVTSINILYTNNELLALYQQWETNKPKDIFLMRLKTQLDNIRTAINAWKSNDETAKKLCNDKILCATQLPTDKLVGFLSNNSEDTNKIWKDEYYYVNATLKENTNNKPAKVTGGFTFSGEGVGAQWLEGKEQKDQPYKFIDPGFTLVATVQIEKNDVGFDNSLLGVVINGNKEKHIQLWCSSGKWAVGGEGNKVLDKKCEKGKTYIVALVLRDGSVLVHVDWEQMTGFTGDEMKIEKTQTIRYFYFGAGSDKLTSAKTDVTITNVLLYNRPFNTSEINGLRVIKKEVNTQALSEGDGNKTPAHEDTTEETSGPETNNSPGTSATPTATEKDGAEIKLSLFSINSVTLFSLLLFCPFTLLGRHVH